MQYIEMSVEDALRLYGKKGTVLVAVQDLESEEDVINFVKKTKIECENVIKSAATIAQGCDEFMRQLKVFSHKQLDLKNIEPVGKMRTILIKK